MARKNEPAPAAAQAATPWAGDLTKAFTTRPDVSHSYCYDAATLKMEEAEQLLQTERLFDEEHCIDWVITAALALMQQARAAYATAYARSAT